MIYSDRNNQIGIILSGLSGEIDLKNKPIVLLALSICLVVATTLFCFTALAKKEQIKTEFKEKLVLIFPREGFGREKAFLFIDDSGKPAIYPIIDRHVRCISLAKHTKSEIEKHWPSRTSISNFHRYIFETWRNGNWEPVSIDLQYKRGKCYLYRVNSNATNRSSWFKVSTIPSAIPIEIGIVDGPRDMSDCRMGPLPKKYTIPISKGMCPHGGESCIESSTKNKTVDISKFYDTNFLTPEYILPKPGEKLFRLQKIGSSPQSTSERKRLGNRKSLVLMIDKNGKATINPEDKGVWSIYTIDLKILSIRDAKYIWGKPRELRADIRTFDLEAAYTKDKINLYRLDTKFVNDKLSSYRVRGTEIAKPEWKKVY